MSSSSEYHFRIHPALTSFADECCATLARLIAYVGVLVLLAILGLHAWDQLQFDITTEAADPTAFTLASRSRPAFAVSAFDLPEKSETYEIFRHPEGGRKDVLRWGFPGEIPLAELEIYRPGGEFDRSVLPSASLAGRMGPDDQRELQAAGVVDSKFGTIALFRRAGRFDASKSCLGFARRLDDPVLQISGWSCQGTSLAARSAAIGCMLDRLTLLASGNDPRLAELFARVELKRSGCATTLSGDWVTGAENPRLRGPM
jgi:hypothetical protein